MKRATSEKTSRREIFVLTLEEKRTIAVVLIMFVLGLVTAHYRAAHSVPPARIGVDETAAATGRSAQKRAEAKRPKPVK